MGLWDLEWDFEDYNFQGHKKTTKTVKIIVRENLTLYSIQIMAPQPAHKCYQKYKYITIYNLSVYTR